MFSWQLSRINKLQYKITKSTQSYFMYLFIKHSKITLFCILETVHCEYCWLLYYTIWVLFLTCDSTDKQKLYLLNEQIWCKWLINWTTSIQGKGRPCQSRWAVWKCTSYCMLNTHLTWFFLQDFPANILSALKLDTHPPPASSLRSVENVANEKALLTAAFINYWRRKQAIVKSPWGPNDGRAEVDRSALKKCLS